MQDKKQASAACKKLFFFFAIAFWSPKVWIGLRFRDNATFFSVGTIDIGTTACFIRHSNDNTAEKVRERIQRKLFFSNLMVELRRRKINSIFLWRQSQMWWCKTKMAEAKNCVRDPFVAVRFYANGIDCIRPAIYVHKRSARRIYCC